VNREPLCRVPQDINLVSFAKSVPASNESPKVASLQANKTTLEPLKPPSLKGAQSPTAAEGAPTSPNHAASSHDATSNFPRPEPAPSPMNSGLLVGRVRAKAHSCLSLENNRVNIRMLQSPYAVIWILSRSDFTSADM
jgi:hypothetical protein